MSRAFKPMPVVLDLVYENFSKYKNLIFFMGKSGKKIFEKSKNDWEFRVHRKKKFNK
jgi:16S rRNA (guanine527-N7)-methyltransferase